MSPRARLLTALVIVAFVAALEFWGGVRANSLALLTDAVHVCMDVFALAIALFALLGAQRPATLQKTFGFGRLEILGAMLNGSVLLAATAFIAYEAVHRFFVPHHPEGAIMSIIAGVGLVANGTVGFMLMGQGKDNLNMRAALFHVAGDALGALAVIVGGAVITATGAAWIDPALSLFVAAIIIVGVVRVVRDAADVLLEGVPRGLDVEDVHDAMQGVTGIQAVHDLHVWTIGSGALALSAHVLVQDARVSEASAIMQNLDALVRERFGITHVTLQFECENCRPDAAIICTQPMMPGQASGPRH
ncbi:MAG TPA: cation diffusion facilitator family transporter [Candidatus Baltobacteraceae bacterium]|nr:cation diffusion facilitator family transporter [Candidatus Baltobacteraceae bacterium]